MSLQSRCSWASTDPLLTYHDTQWGVPVHDDRLLFEMLNLEGAQAGLSWLTILKKRANYLKAFNNFNARKILKYTSAKRKALLKNPGIVRNRLKIDAVILNARAFLDTQREFGSFNKYIWSFVDHQSLPTPSSSADKRRAIAISEKMSKDLKKRGFKFVGPTICYAFMQATGLLNDHSPSCFLSSKR